MRACQVVDMWLVVRLLAANNDARNPAATESIADDTVGRWGPLTLSFLGLVVAQQLCLTFEGA